MGLPRVPEAESQAHPPTPQGLRTGSPERSRTLKRFLDPPLALSHLDQLRVLEQLGRDGIRVRHLDPQLGQQRLQLLCMCREMAPLSAEDGRVGGYLRFTDVVPTRSKPFLTAGARGAM